LGERLQIFDFFKVATAERRLNWLLLDGLLLLYLDWLGRGRICGRVKELLALIKLEWLNWRLFCGVLLRGESGL